MVTLKKSDAIQQLESFMKAVGGAPKEWYVGVAHDAAARLDQHGMRGNTYATAIQCKDEQTARAIERYFLESGTQGDTRGSTPATPATQVYAFRAPRLTSFREWLRAQEEAGADRGRRERREAWVAAANRFLARCREWVTEADPNGILALQESSIARAETHLGRYEVGVLTILHEARRITLVPLAGTTLRELAFGDRSVPTSGRIDISNGVEKYMAYRTEEQGQDRWYFTPENGPPSEVNEDAFLAILEEFLS